MKTLIASTLIGLTIATTAAHANTQTDNTQTIESADAIQFMHDSELDAVQGANFQWLLDIIRRAARGGSLKKPLNAGPVIIR